MNAPSGNGFIGSWDQNCGVQTKNGDFWPFLAFEGRFGGLKDPPEVRVEDKTCPGQNLKAFRAKKIGPGWQGGSETNFGVGAWVKKSRFWLTSA